VSDLSAPLRRKLRVKYQWPEWAFFEETSLGAGRDGLQYYAVADAVAFGMQGTTGRQLYGFEIKATRSDWLAEMRKPAKSDSVLRYCHRWWLVADKLVARAEELPPTWGWLAPHGNGLRVMRPAPLLTPEPLGPGQVGALIYAAVTTLNRNADTATMKEEAYQAGLRDGKWQRQMNPDEASQLREQVEAFEEASGIKINGWYGAKELGEAAKFVLDGGLAAQKRSLQFATESLYEALYSLSRVVPVLPARNEQPVVELRKVLDDAGRKPRW
jgi:hypothetical protein